MRLGNLAGRAVLIDGDTAVDVWEASDGGFGPDPGDVLKRWGAFRAWAAQAETPAGVPFREEDLGIPVPSPRQVFAIGLNYRDHAAESGQPLPDHLVVFTKFASSLAAPFATVRLPADTVDYETELVVVIGVEASGIAPEEAWEHVAGVSIGQDLSERTMQLQPPTPQFSLAKSYAGFGPFGPAIVTVDELDDRDAIGIRSALTRADGSTQRLQDGNTRDLVFDVPGIVSGLSEVVTLYPGDLIFTGTPAGIGGPRGIFLRPGDTLVSEAVGVGTISNRFTG